MSKDPAADIKDAERRQEEARAHLSDTLNQLQAKLSPKVLARDAGRKAVSAGQDAADVARRNPGPVAGGVAVFGLFLARHRIARLFRRKPKKVPAAPISHTDY